MSAEERGVGMLLRPLETRRNLWVHSWHIPWIVHMTLLYYHLPFTNLLWLNVRLLTDKPSIWFIFLFRFFSVFFHSFPIFIWNLLCINKTLLHLFKCMLCNSWSYLTKYCIGLFIFHLPFHLCFTKLNEFESPGAPVVQPDTSGRWYLIQHFFEVYLKRLHFSTLLNLNYNVECSKLDEQKRKRMNGPR